MDVSGIAGAAAGMMQASGREEINMKVMKMAAESEKQVANMLAAAAEQQKSDPQYNLSLYA